MRADPLDALFVLAIRENKKLLPIVGKPAPASTITKVSGLIEHAIRQEADNQRKLAAYSLVTAVNLSSGVNSLAYLGACDLLSCVRDIANVTCRVCGSTWQTWEQVDTCRSCSRGELACDGSSMGSDRYGSR